jgi:hypothetical protein
MKRVYTATEPLPPLDLAPQAVVNVSVAKLHHDQGIDFESGEDDLDTYKAAYFRLDDNQIVALIHHAREPQGSISIYLDRGLGPKRVKKVVHAVITSLGIADGLVGWVETEVLRPPIV